MSAPAPAPLKRTPLYSLHRELGAKMVDFGGWEMPIGLALLPSGAQTVGTEFEIDIRGRRARARVVETPFYKRKKEASA